MLSSDVPLSRVIGAVFLEVSYGVVAIIAVYPIKLEAQLLHVGFLGRRNLGVVGARLEQSPLEARRLFIFREDNDAVVLLTGTVVHVLAEGLADELVNFPIGLLAPLGAVLDSIAGDTSELAFVRAQRAVGNHGFDKFL